LTAGRGMHLNILGPEYVVIGQLIDCKTGSMQLKTLDKDYVSNGGFVVCREGIMHVNILGLDQVFVGDFDTLKFLYNHPDIQNRGQYVQHFKLFHLSVFHFPSEIIERLSRRVYRISNN
jgi:hypothetical protein